MHPRDMRGIQQVVGDVQVIAGHGHGLTLVVAPGGVFPVRDVVNCLPGCAGRLTHPDPQQAVTVFQWKSPHQGSGRNVVGAWHLDAAPAAVKAQTVVATLQQVALDAPLRER